MYAFVVVALLVSQLAPGAEAPERFPYSAGLQAIHDRAFQAVEERRLDDAVADVEHLLAQAPENPRTFHLAGQLYVGQQKLGDTERALLRALELGLDGMRRADALSLLGATYYQLNRRAEAEPLLREALQLDERLPTANFYSALLALNRSDFERMREHARRITEVVPGSSEARILLASALASLGELDEAEAEVRRARELGGNEEHLRLVEAEISQLRWTRLAWGIPLGLGLFLGLGLLGTWVAGRVLSSVQLGQLRAEHVHLMRAEQTPSERRVDRLYSAVLWFASLLFYVSIPMMLTLTVAVAGGLIYAMFQLRFVSIKLLIIVALVGFGGFIAILRGLFFSTAEPDEGRRLAPDEAPELFRALAEVAEVAGARKVDRVMLFAGTSIGVREAGGRIQVLLGRGERILHLGLAALRGLTVSELKSILAHEYGHFAHGETRLTPIIGRIQTQVVRTMQSIQELSWAFVNPVFWFLRVYFFVYLQVTAGHGRRRELLADRLSALAYGGDTFGRALTKTIENGDAFHRGVGVAVGLREAGRPTKDLYRTIDVAARGTPPSLGALVREELFARPVDAYDSHPPPSERVQRVAGIPGRRMLDEAPALTLFADPVKLAEELGGEVLTHVDIALQEQGIAAPEPVASTEEEQDRLAEAIALHHGALALGERNHPDAYALLQESVARLEDAAGTQDPFLVPALTELSKVHVQHQDPVAARALLQRALGIVQARPGHEQQVDALNEMLQGLPTQQAA
ncbi:M48 family metalloprotease [Pyxidicoccus trucidator]|uniref:M48 family metalloprotease n=1 Tax=Pyxidicoccus trucidator TaxID=2709662 RepID=UPI0013DD7895|nr:M48 family metalloprotease [Pyxidicoccus trucidator]